MTTSAEMYLPHFVVRQKLTMMINRYEVSESTSWSRPPSRSRSMR